MFNQPNDGGGYFKPANALNHLILILEVHKIETVVDTFGGQVRNVDEATVDIVDLDEPGQELRQRCKIGNVGIVNRLVPGAKMVLGRIGQVPTDKGNPAWVLNGFDETQDAPRAAAWVTAYQSGQFQSAAPAVPAPAPAVPAPAAVDPAVLAAAQAQLAAQQAAAAAVPAQAAPAAPAVDQAALAALLGQLGAQPVSQ